MKISVYCVGFFNYPYWKSACGEYLKRIRPYSECLVEEFPDLPTKENLSPKEEREIRRKEWEKPLSKIKPGDFVVALDLNQKELDSIEFSSFLEEGFHQGRSHVVFLIGGSLGLSEEAKSRASASLSFGRMTFPHQLARVMLLEQIYRAFRIARHEPYHK